MPVLLGFLLVAGVAGALLVRASRGPAVGRAVAASVSIPVAAAPSASTAPVAAPSASASASGPAPSAVTLVALPPSDPRRPRQAPRRAHDPPVGLRAARRFHRRARAPPPAPSCHVVSYFDADGNKHFRQECP